MFKKRLGPDPHINEGRTTAAQGCPDIWELADGSFAVIGTRQTKQLQGALPPTASCGYDEEIIVIPRKTLILAKDDIPLEQPDQHGVHRK